MFVLLQPYFKGVFGVKGAPGCRMSCPPGGGGHLSLFAFLAFCRFCFCFFFGGGVPVTIFGSEGKAACAFPQCLLFPPGHMTPQCWLQCDTHLTRVWHS